MIDRYHYIHDNRNRPKSFAIATIALSFILFTVIAIQQANITTSDPVKMTAVDTIKQNIREKEHLRDEYTKAAKDAVARGDYTVADKHAEEIGKLVGEIEKLYADLHEANVSEGDEKK
jgi:hypothetical protein